MKVVGFKNGGELTPQTFQEFDLDLPVPTDHDVLVHVSAVSVNPVDTKVRRATGTADPAKILGYDAVGTVTEIGSAVENFSEGDRVYYAGSNQRAGSNQEYQLVDERIISLAPSNLTDAEAAALPLTLLTAYEMIFEKFGARFKQNGNPDRRILIVNGAGGVGSVAIQLARWSGMEVITTASRSESVDWVKGLGADIVLDHHQDLASQLPADYVNNIDYVMILHDTEPYFETAAQLIKPLGHVGSIVETSEPVALGLLKDKAASFDWEFMFAKAKYGVDMASQGEALRQLADLLDQGLLKTTRTKTINGLTADSLYQAHQLVESGRMVGKVVIKY